MNNQEEAHILGLKKRAWDICRAHRGETLHIGSLIALAGQPDHRRGDVTVQTREDLLVRLVRAMEADLMSGARLVTESRNGREELFTRWKVPSSAGGLWDVTILVSPTSGDIIGRSCTCEDCLKKLPGWCCKHILAVLASTRLPYQDPYILVSAGGIEKVRSGDMTRFTFSRAAVGRVRPSPKSIWFGVKGTPSQNFCKVRVLSWKPDQDRVEAEWI